MKNQPISLNNKRPENTGFLNIDRKNRYSYGFSALIIMFTLLVSIESASAAFTQGVSGSITAAHSGKCIAVQGGSTADNTPIVQITCNGSNNQGFIPKAAGGNFYNLIAAHSNKCLDVPGGSVDDNKQIEQFRCDGSDEQKFGLRPAGGGYVNIVAKHSGKCLDIPNGTTSDNAAVNQYQCDGSNEQKFTSTAIVNTAPVPRPTYQAPAPRPTYQAPVPRPTYQAPVPRPTYQTPVPRAAYPAPVPRAPYPAPAYPAPAYPAPAYPAPAYPAPAYRAPAYPAPTRAPVIQQNSRVLAKWSDGYWYPATVEKMYNSQYTVIWDDGGDRYNVLRNQIAWLNWNIGSHVQCNWRGEGTYYNGTITTKHGNNIHISYDDGDQENTSFARCRVSK